MTTSTILIHKIESEINIDFFDNLYQKFKNLEGKKIQSNLTNDRHCMIKKIEHDNFYYDRNIDEIAKNHNIMNDEIRLINIIIDYGKNCDNLQRIRNDNLPSSEKILTNDDYLMRFYYVSIILFRNNIYMIYQFLNNEGCAFIIENEIKKLYKNKNNTNIKISKIGIPLKIDSISNLDIESYILPKDISGNIKKEKVMPLKSVFTFFKKYNKNNLKNIGIIDDDIINSLNSGKPIKDHIIKNIESIYKVNLTDNFTDNEIFIKFKLNNIEKRVQITDDNLSCYSRIETNKILKNDFSNIEEIKKEILENFKNIIIKFAI